MKKIFESGEAVVLPNLGVCIAQRYRAANVHLREPEVLLLTRVDDGTWFAVATSQLVTLGTRAPVTAAELEDVFAVLTTRPRRVSTVWARRWRAHAAMLKGGAVLDLASVVRNLFHLSQSSGLSAGEASMFNRSRLNLAHEVAFVSNVSLEEALALLDAPLQRGLPPSPS